MANLLGIDFGTTSLKACLFNDKGERLTSESAKYNLITEGEFIEFPVEKFYEVFLSVYEKIEKKYKIDAFTVDTQGETLIVLDKNGAPLMNAIIWLDNRADAEAKEMEEKFGLEKIYNLTGQAEIPAGYPAPKIMWIKKNRPEIFAKADKFLLLEDYILYRLTGKFVASRSLYSSSLLMNVHDGEYIQEILDYLAITKAQLPTLVESGTVVGKYNGAVVGASALDQIAGATGAGIIKENLISETTGTSLAVVAVTKNFPKYYDGLKVSVYYMSKGVYCLLMWAPTAGATLEWFKKNFAFSVDFNKLNELAEVVPEGSEGLICIPHLCGTVMPENNPNVKGSFFGFELKHGLGHFVRAIMESIAYTVKEFLEFMDLDVSEIRCMGGGANSRLWCKIKSAVLGKKIVTLSENETACLGSAIFAGVATGVFDSVKSACEQLISIKNQYQERKGNYEMLYKQYKTQEQKLINIF